MTSEKILSQKLMRFFSILYREIRRAAHEQGQGPLSIPQVRILRMLQLSKGPLTNKDLACDLGVDVTSVSRMISLLEKKKLLSREKCLTDRRCQFLKLTAQGGKLLDRSLAGIHDCLSLKLKLLTAQKRALVEETLDLLLEAIS